MRIMSPKNLLDHPLLLCSLLLVVTKVQNGRLNLVVNNAMMPFEIIDGMHNLPFVVSLYDPGTFDLSIKMITLNSNAFSIVVLGNYIYLSFKLCDLV